jgi:serine/tyrosine/threonine adenylyltransferase
MLHVGAGERSPMARRASAPIVSFLNSYARLPGRFFARVDPTPVAAPRLIQFNQPLANELGLQTASLDADELAEIFSGNATPLGAEPIAMAYAGHQFAHFVPLLGDGRAILLGEVLDRDGARRDIQLKGSGLTPFSRRGDGRAALGPVLREYLVSEAMHALGVPTTRALAAVSTGEPVRREGRLPGAVLTRVAASHLRIGTFELFAAQGDVDAVRRLADYTIDRHYPAAREDERPYLALLRAVADRQARLVARWMHLGFIHGVMNTDNTALSGETIDFGPCAFMDAYDPATSFSAIDRFGRYAYANQPGIAEWNLARLADALLALIDEDLERANELASEAISAFSDSFEGYWLAGMRAKFGLLRAEEGDRALVLALFEAMHANAADFTLTFRRLCDAALDSQADAGARALFAAPEAYDAWAEGWRARLTRERVDPRDRASVMRRVNPAFIPRNHRIEQALEAAMEREDFAPFAELLKALARPYEDQERFQRYADPPKEDERVFQTFCGT